MIESTELYAACRSDDPTQQTAGYQALWDYLYRVTYNVVRDQPSADALAQESAQKAIVKIYRQIETCRSAAAFKSWSRTIASRLAIDELRARKRVVFNLDEIAEYGAADSSTGPEKLIGNRSLAQDVRELLQHAPISDRSYRVIKGRYLDEVSDEEIASAESKLAKQEVLPYHVQVTRSKNISKLRKWELLGALFDDSQGNAR